MAKSSTTFQPGASGNPNGRPRKDRALTTILEAAGNQTTAGPGDKRTARKRIVAALLWELASTGRATFPDGTILEADPADWLSAVKWLYQHIDGPPKQQLEHSGPGGGPMEVTIADLVTARQRALEYEKTLLTEG